MILSIYLNKKALVFICIFFSAYFVFAQAKVDPGYSVGYKKYKATDSSRRYKPDAAKSDLLFNRPEEIDVWYPARLSSESQPLDYPYFLSLFERRANTFQDSIKYNGLANELMQHFTVANDRTKTHLKTNSFFEASAVAGRFPLIIYMSAFNGMSYENVHLFESLASRGYIVISISSIGRYPGNMTTKYPDVLEQVNDAEFVLHLMGNKNIDTSKIGVIGYSYGGIAAALFAMKNKSVKAILSMDGSEMHYYGRDKGEDKDFDNLRQSKYFNPLAMQCSYAYLESDHKSDDGSADSIYHLPTSIAIKKYYARFLGAEHEDFSGISALGKNENPIYQSANELALNYFEQTLKNTNQLFDTDLTSLLTAKRISLTQINPIQKLGQVVLSGRIINATSGAPLPYATIGIPASNCGTISGADGKFSLQVADTLIGGVVRISSLGYQPKSFNVKQLLTLLPGNATIKLNEQVNQLAQVTIRAAKLHMRTVGNTSQSKFLNVGFPLKDLGSEVGIRVSLGKKKVRLRSFNFNISNTRMDSCTFRLNIYASKGDVPAENLLTQNIIAVIGNKPGAYSIDLAPYQLILDGSIFVSLEWIAGKSSTGHGAVFFSAGLLSSSYHRKTAEADWVKFKGLGAAFNLKVEEE